MCFYRTKVEVLRIAKVDEPGGCHSSPASTGDGSNRSQAGSERRGGFRWVCYGFLHGNSRLRRGQRGSRRQLRRGFPGGMAAGPAFGAVVEDWLRMRAVSSQPDWGGEGTAYLAGSYFWLIMPCSEVMTRWIC